MLGFFDQTTFMKDLGGHFVTSVEILLDLGEADLDPLFLENVGESTLWQTALERHLSALKTRTAAVAGTRLLSLMSAACGFSQTRTGTTSNALFLMGRTLRRF